MPGLLSPMPMGLPQRMQMPTALPGPYPAAPQIGAQAPGAGIMKSIGDQFRQFTEQNPGALMALGAGVMAGNPAAGFAAAAPMIAEGRKRNKTVEYLKQRDPELAEYVESGGLSAADAFKLHVAERRAPKTEPTASMREFDFARSQGFEGSFMDYVDRNRGSGGEVDQYGFPSSGSISQRIRALEMQGFDQQTALGIASGRYSVSVNPATGERALIDVASQKILPLQQPNYATPGGEAQPAPRQSAGPTLWDMAGEGTGVGPALRSGATNTLGQLPGAVGETFTFPETIEAGQNFELFKRDLVRSLSLNPRFPVAEQQRIESLIPRGAMTSEATLRTSLQALDQEMSRIEAEVSAGMNNPQTPIEQRQADAQTLRSIRAARARLGIPQGSGGDTTGAPEGVDPGDWEFMTDEERSLWQ